MKGECQEFCAWGHNRADGGRIWRSRSTLDDLLAGRDPKAVFSKDGLFDELKKALAERVLNAELDVMFAGRPVARPFVQVRTRVARACRAEPHARRADHGKV